MVEARPTNAITRVNVGTVSGENVVQATNSLAAYYSDLAKQSEQKAKDWANKLDGTVDGSEYSAKYYAQECKEEAEKAISNIETAGNEKLAEIEGVREDITQFKADIEQQQTDFETYIEDNIPTASVEETASGATITVTSINGTTTADILNGAKGDKGDKGDTGEQGVSVTGVTLISTVGLDKTYRMNFSNGTYFDYVVSNGAAGATEWGGISGVLSNQADLQSALDNKQATLVSGTNIKTINGNSILGSGNVDIISTTITYWE